MFNNAYLSLFSVKLVESVVQNVLSGGAAVFERETLLDETNIQALGTHVKHFNRVLHAQVCTHEQVCIWLRLAF